MGPNRALSVVNATVDYKTWISFMVDKAGGSEYTEILCSSWILIFSVLWNFVICGRGYSDILSFIWLGCAQPFLSFLWLFIHGLLPFSIVLNSHFPIFSTCCDLNCPLTVGLIEGEKVIGWGLLNCLLWRWCRLSKRC